MKKTIRKILALIPTKLPIGVEAFNTWSDDILDLYDMPNNDSTKFAIAVSVLHLKSTDAYVPKHYFGNILLKGAASQIANSIMIDCKERQAALAKAEQEAAAANVPLES